jgi:hypothetical protein
VSKRAIATLLLLASVAVGQNKPAHLKPETPHLAFVKEYVRELISDEDLKTTGQKELNEAKTTGEQISTAIYFSDAYTRGLLLRRPIEAMTPFVFTGERDRATSARRRGDKRSRKHRAHPVPTAADDQDSGCRCWTHSEGATLSASAAYARVRGL